MGRQALLLIESMRKKTEPLFQILIATKNLITTLAVKHPAFFTAFLLLAGWFVFVLGTTQIRMVAVLCIIISLISTIIFVKTREFGQTSLAFIIGLFTVFSITWNRELWWIFVGFYVGFNTLLLVIASVRIAGEVETILTQAASFSGEPDFKRVYRKLHGIVSNGAKHQLGIIERSHIVRFLCFRKIPTTEIELLLPQIETVNTASMVGHVQVTNFFFTLYNATNSRGDGTKVRNLIKCFDVIFQLPCAPEEFFALFEKTKNCLLRNRIALDTYLAKIHSLMAEGRSTEEIIEEFT